MKKSNVSIFVTHKGCKNLCSFCDQKSISGSITPANRDDVVKAVQTAIQSGCSSDSEIAFFGGSFTAIDKDYMLSLLSAAYPFLKSGSFSGIRVSTRPDEIDAERLRILKDYGVTAIELGAQSMDDEVLRKNRRGHTAKDVEDASLLIKEFGFSLGLQMMTGLYGSTDETDRKTFNKILSLNPDTVRIYPTVTLEGTYLETLLNEGKYIPPTLEQTVELCSEFLMQLEKTDITLLRLGLHSTESMNSKRVAGPYHEAFGQLCRSRVMLKKALPLLDKKGINEILIHPDSLSDMQGHKKENLVRLKDMGYSVKILTDDTLKKREIKIIKKEEE
ncbi:MAG: radical SAM protein [Clostridia bacterium]|nr:radical SAM protein [Clostridia bacterium]